MDEIEVACPHCGLWQIISQENMDNKEAFCRDCNEPLWDEEPPALSGALVKPKPSPPELSGDADFD